MQTDRKQHDRGSEETSHPLDGGDDPFLEVPEEEGKFHIVGLALIPECQGEGRKFLGRNVCATLRMRVHV